MFDRLRRSTWKTALDIMTGLTRGYDPEKKVVFAVGGIKKLVCMVAGVAGACMFVGSFSFLILPFMGAMWWGHAVVSFVGAQWTSQIFMDLHETWDKAAAWLYLVIFKLRGKKWNEIFSKEDFAAVNQPLPA